MAGHQCASEHNTSYLNRATVAYLIHTGEKSFMLIETQIFYGHVTHVIRLL